MLEQEGCRVVVQPVDGHALSEQDFHVLGVEVGSERDQDRRGLAPAASPRTAPMIITSGLGPRPDACLAGADGVRPLND